LQFNWSDKNASGIQSIIWRKNWEITKDETFKSKLIRYNLEDCIVLIKIKNLISSIIANETNEVHENITNTVYYKDLKKESKFNFQSKNFAIPEIDLINKCSYFNYQRDRVYARINPIIKQTKNKRKNKYKNNYPSNKKIMIYAKTCSLCGGKQINKGRPIFKKVIDLKFSKSGVKRWIIQYESGIYYCRNCKKNIISKKYLNINLKYGHNLISWAVYQHIVNKESFRQIESNFFELFSLHIPKSTIHEFKTYMFNFYDYTYRQLKKKILNSNVIYMDETPLIMKNEKGYAWILTNEEEVISFYKATREGEFLKDFFRNFKNILVTDFYAAYDSIDCLQQKCLIHFIRDFNDDLLKNPFDLEFKQIAQIFTSILQNIVNTIDKYGLKKRNLYKHKKEVNKFINEVLTTKYSSEVSIQYQKRIAKNKDKLFLFLNYDNVFWNNSNAEHAIKLLATHRNRNINFFETTRIDEYLKIMSIFQTCEYKEISFLKFLLSQEKDIDKYYEKNVIKKRRKKKI